MKPEVRAQFPSFTVRFEGRVPTMYADIKGLITIGLGCLIDPVTLATSLPFHRHSPNGPRASVGEIAGEWQRLKAMDLGKWHFATQRAKAGLTLWLDDDGIDDLARTRLDTFEHVLVKQFPEWEQWPAEAQLAVLSMAWGMGPGFPAHWPQFTAAALQQDWALCSMCCRMREAGNPGVVPRNKANTALFKAAAVRPAPAGITDDDRARLDYLLTVWLDKEIYGAPSDQDPGNAS